jgi:hypothetical protein
MRAAMMAMAMAAMAAGAYADAAPPPQVPAMTAQTLGCTGPFTRSATHASLVKHFGARNVAWETVDGPEGSTYQVTAIFPKDPKRRLEAVWRDEEGRKDLLSVDVKSEGTAWTGPAGVAMKMPIAEVERRNARPFALAGFQWDMWGWVLDWKDGKLPQAAKDLGCDTFTVRFEETGDASKAAGEGPFASNAKGMRRARPIVASFGVGFAYPDAAQ